MVRGRFFLSKPPVSEADSVRLYNLRRSSHMCVRHVVDSSSRIKTQDLECDQSGGASDKHRSSPTDGVNTRALNGP
jgi:hypothetical protein